MKTLKRSRHPKAGAEGLTLIEVTISMLIVATVLLASAQTFAMSLKATDQAHNTTDAAVYLETAMEDLSAQPFKQVLSLHGETIFDGEDLDSSHYSIGLEVFLVEVDLLQINALVTELATGRVVCRLASQRCHK
jgi:type II secretory pathway component PulJ